MNLRASTGLLAPPAEKVRQHLITTAEEKAVTTYSAVRSVVGNPPFVRWKALLAEVDGHELSHGRPPLSPLIVSTKDKAPKYGCRDSARLRKDPLAKDPEFEAKARDRAWDFWQKVKQLVVRNRAAGSAA